jgi:hypothetical protein
MLATARRRARHMSAPPEPSSPNAAALAGASGIARATQTSTDPPTRIADDDLEPDRHCRRGARSDQGAPSPSRRPAQPSRAATAVAGPEGGGEAPERMTRRDEALLGIGATTFLLLGIWLGPAMAFWLTVITAWTLFWFICAAASRFWVRSHPPFSSDSSADSLARAAVIEMVTLFAHAIVGDESSSLSVPVRSS